MTFLKYLNIAIVSLSGIATFNYAYNAIDNASAHKDTKQFNDPSKCENTSAYNSKLQTKLIWMLTVSSVLVVAGIVLIILKRHDAGRLYHVGWALLGAGLIGIFWGVQEKYLETQTDNIMAVGCAIVFVVSLLLLLFVTGKGHGGDAEESDATKGDDTVEETEEEIKARLDVEKSEKEANEAEKKAIEAETTRIRLEQLKKRNEQLEKRKKQSIIVKHKANEQIKNENKTISEMNEQENKFIRRKCMQPFYKKYNAKKCEETNKKGKNTGNHNELMKTVDEIRENAQEIIDRQKVDVSGYNSSSLSEFF
jgi:uncharacterized membrane protein